MRLDPSTKIEPADDASPVDRALIDYINEHHEIDMAMRVVAGDGRVNDICAAFRAGAEWQRSLHEGAKSGKRGRGTQHENSYEARPD